MRSIKNLSLTKLPDKSNYAVIGDQDGLRTPGRLQDYMAIIWASLGIRSMPVDNQPPPT